MSKLKCSCVAGFENMFLFFLWHGDIPTNNFISNMLKNFSNSIHQNLWILVLWPSSGSKSKFNNWFNIYKYLVKCHCNFGLNILFGVLSSSASNPTPLNFDSEMKWYCWSSWFCQPVLLIVITMKTAKGYYILRSGLGIYYFGI